MFRFVRVLAAFLVSLAAPLTAADYWMYVGTYTTAGGSKGIYAWRYDPDAGKFTEQGLAATTPNPSFLAINPNGKFLYAVNEISHFQHASSTGSVTAFTIDRATSKLTLLNAQPSRGDGPCHLALDREGKCVIVANYNNGSVAAFGIGSNGALVTSASFFQHQGVGANPQRQAGPHAHCVAVSPDDRFALVADLGLDEVLSYRLDAAHATITPNEPPFVKVAPGSGPRHLAFHPNGKFVYLINEMKSTIDAFAWEAQSGALKSLQTISTLPDSYKGSNDTAEIQVHPSGKFLYGSNRGHDSIAVFRIESKTGNLTPIEFVSTEGKTPRSFAIDPTGKFLLAANQQTNDIVVFKIDAASGHLTPTGQKLRVIAPVCIVFAPAL